MLLGAIRRQIAALPPCGSALAAPLLDGGLMLITQVSQVDQLFRLSMGTGGTRSAGSKPRIRPRK